MAIFDKKIWNDVVFQKYLKKVPNLKENSLLKNGVLEVNNSLKSRLVDGVGGNFLIEPIKGLLDGDFVNYDGRTTITTSSRGTFMQGKIVCGRAKGWEEKDFSTELTGENWMEGIAGEVAEYWQGVDMGDILAILKGIFSMSSANGRAFADQHTTEIEGAMNATTINTAAQKAFGDKKNRMVSMAFMHSNVATGLENLQLLEYLKYTDSNGITSNIEIAQVGNKTVIIDDDMPVVEVEAEYELTSDVAIDSSKTYYTRTGSGTSQSPYVYTAVATPDVDDIATYYEVSAEAYLAYTTYLLGKGAIEYCNVGVKTPSEVARDAATDGGIDKLYTRQRKLYAPKYISWEGNKSIISPMPADLENGANWDVVNDGNKTVSARVYVNHRNIPFARIITRG